METKQRPTISVADFSFIRSLFDDIVELRWLRTLLLRRIDVMRSRIITRVVNALYRRYKKYTKGMKIVPGFLEWLDAREYMHETYNFHSFATRYYWASRPVTLAARYELSTDLRHGKSDAGDDSWYFRGLQQAINAKDPRSDAVLKVRKDFYDGQTKAEPKFKLKSNEVRAAA